MVITLPSALSFDDRCSTLVVVVVVVVVVLVRKKSNASKKRDRVSTVQCNINARQI
jgi:hypothetical protein